VRGGPAGELTWHRGRPCESGACVEIAALPDAIMVRSTANPDGAIFAMSRDEWREFLAVVKAGLFDEV
jgi:predicted secreted Zn-dependent protease